MRFLALLWGFVAYLAFWAALLWTIVFLGYNVVPKKYQEQLYTQLPWAADLESGGPANEALIKNVGLLAAFLIPSVLMSLTGCCNVCSKIVGKPATRSTHVLISCLLLGLVYWKWLPIPEEVWSLPQYKTPLQYAFWAGWVLVLVGSFMAGHFELTGLRQVFRYFRGQEQSPPANQGQGLQAIGRHVLTLGLLLGLLATPRMTLGHELFAVPLALYVILRWAMSSRGAAPAAAEPVPAPAAG